FRGRARALADQPRCLAHRSADRAGSRGPAQAGSRTASRGGGGLDGAIRPVQGVPFLILRSGVCGYRSRDGGPHRGHGPYAGRRPRRPPGPVCRHDPGQGRQLRLCGHRVPAGSGRPRRFVARARTGTNAQADARASRLAATNGWEACRGGVAERDHVAVLAEVLQRDGAQRSATETWRQELSGADHLGVLGFAWYDLSRRAQLARFEQALRDSLPPADSELAISDAACTWLWRSLREAEAAGIGGAPAAPAADGSDPRVAGPWRPRAVEA